MTLTQASVEVIAEQFRNGNPDDQYKQSPRVSRRALVATLYDSIIAKRKAGYSYDGIIAYLEQLGAPMSVSTLKTYLVEVGKQNATKPTKTRKQLTAHAAPKLEDTRQQLPATISRASSPEKRGTSEPRASLTRTTDASQAVHDARAESPAAVEVTRLRNGETTADEETAVAAIQSEKEAATRARIHSDGYMTADAVGEEQGDGVEVPPAALSVSSQEAERTVAATTSPIPHVGSREKEANPPRGGTPEVAADDVRKRLDEVRSRASSPAARRMAFVPRDDRDL